MNLMISALLVCLCAPRLGAAVLQDWSQLVPGIQAGTWADAVGSTVTFRSVEGPSPESRALRLDAKLVQWGGVWTAVTEVLPSGGALRFSAFSPKALVLNVILADSEYRQTVHAVRLRGGSWERFDLPFSTFAKPDWTNPKASPGVFDPLKLAIVSFSPASYGVSECVIGPLETVKTSTILRDGFTEGVVQDFIALPVSAYGSYSDKLGSSITLSVKGDAPEHAGLAARVEYSEAQNGWCGVWLRAGTNWNGQNWIKARGLVAEVYSAVPLTLQFAFNDANQVAYVSPLLPVLPGAWRTVPADFRTFSLNPYYQPPLARKGSPLDLSRVDTVNISAMTPGKHSFWVRLIRLED